MPKFWKGLLLGLAGGFAAKKYADSPEGKKAIKNAKIKAKEAAEDAKEKVSDAVKKEMKKRKKR